MCVGQKIEDQSVFDSVPGLAGAVSAGTRHVVTILERKCHECRSGSNDYSGFVEIITGILRQDQDLAGKSERAQYLYKARNFYRGL